MSAKLRHGHRGGERAHGSDDNTPHERLMKQHRMPGRREGASVNHHNEVAGIHGSPPPSPVDSAPPMGSPSMSMPMTGAEGPPGSMGPGTSPYPPAPGMASDDGEQT